jgi:hypothetical protein
MKRLKDSPLTIWLFAATVAVVAGCGGLDDFGGEVNPDCDRRPCRFEGDAAAQEMIAEGLSSTGDWGDFREVISEHVDSANVGQFADCTGQQLTVTYAPSAFRGLPPFHLVVTRWNLGESACVGEFTVVDLPFPAPADGSLPGPGDTQVLRLPQVGATLLVED